MSTNATNFDDQIDADIVELFLCDDDFSEKAGLATARQNNNHFFTGKVTFDLSAVLTQHENANTVMESTYHGVEQSAFIEQHTVPNMHPSVEYRNSAPIDFAMMDTLNNNYYGYSNELDKVVISEESSMVDVLDGSQCNQLCAVEPLPLTACSFEPMDAKLALLLRQSLTVLSDESSSSESEDPRQRSGSFSSGSSEEASVVDAEWDVHPMRASGNHPPTDLPQSPQVETNQAPELKPCPDRATDPKCDSTTHKTSKPRKHEPTSKEFVDDVKDCDVLFGRGSGPSRHSGNICFRDAIAASQSIYASLDKREKTKLATDIVENVHAKGGRFLDKDETNGRWYVAHFKAARTKTAMALRTVNTPAARAARREKYGC